MNIKLNIEHIKPFVSEKEIKDLITLNKDIIDKSYKCEIGQDDRKGWFEVLNHANNEKLEEILTVSKRVRENVDVFVVIGIGGSNRSSLMAINGLINDNNDGPEILWAGNNLSGVYLKRIFNKIKDKSVYINVIAKDFNTIEPGLVFRMFRENLKAKYGNKYNERIIVSGSEGKGQLKEMAEKYNYTFLPFPENVGGRFSVLTPVGLLPMAVYGIDIKKIVASAHKTEKYLKSLAPEENPAVIYPIIRKLLFKKGYHIESMCVFEPQLEHFARWWLQEFGETEGKKADVIFPTYFVYSEDLHSMGQYVQEGRRFVFETFIKSFEDSKLKVLPSKEEDGFDYMSNRDFDDANKAVYDATLKAHSMDNIPVLEFEIPSVSEELFGELYYFFLFSVYISANLIKVNPFNQDGVENYKLNMYKILGK